MIERFISVEPVRPVRPVEPVEPVGRWGGRQLFSGADFSDVVSGIE